MLALTTLFLSYETSPMKTWILPRWTTTALYARDFLRWFSDKAKHLNRLLL